MIRILDQTLTRELLGNDQYSETEINYEVQIMNNRES